MFVQPPPSGANPHAGPASVSPESGAIDDRWRPPTTAPLQLGTAPPPPLVLAARQAKESAGATGARRRNWWVALAALALCAGGANLRAYRSGRHAVAASSLPLGATPAGIASATAMTFAPPLASTAPSVGEIPAALPSTYQAPAFDPMAAKLALNATASAVTRCQRNRVPASAYAIVTFGNDGAVTHCAVSPPFLGTAAGRCVTKELMQVRLPPFVGDPGVVIHHFVEAAQ
jgi:hypothetical protein